MSPWYGPSALHITNVLRPSSIAYRHRYSSAVPLTNGVLTRDAVGLIYTIRGGFIDFGHLRDVADLAAYYHSAITASPSAGSVFTRPHKSYFGHVRLHSDVPATDIIGLACGIAYAESIFHEIWTYWTRGIGTHQSAFSPEDQPSNQFGAHIADQALRHLDTANTASDRAALNTALSRARAADARSRSLRPARQRTRSASGRRSLVRRRLA
ncbi:DUF4056 domain-containing protein [Nocardia sp. NPDC051570]|uniref:DUF4056 domain-containing protein n=1 Tax=Nocardia sp. NPDC051570 TaxID=3364324 RepID=UPI0037BB4825